MTEDRCVPFVSDCHVRAGVDLIAHTWDSVLLAALRIGPTRRKVLLQRISGVSDKVLTESLRRLVERGMVQREARGPGADGALYALTELGTSFAEGPLAHLAAWAAQHQAALSESP